MTTELENLYRRAEGRYFDDVEAGQLTAYAESVLSRLAIAAAIERAEPMILDDVCAKVMAAGPKLPADHRADMEARVRRDQLLVLRYATHAMLAHDPDFIYDKLSVWLRTILVALVPHEVVMVGYRALVEACARHLTAPDHATLLPFLKVHIDEFASHHGSKAA